MARVHLVVHQVLSTVTLFAKTAGAGVHNAGGAGCRAFCFIDTATALSLPSVSEGFDEVRYEWLPQEKCQER